MSNHDVVIVGARAAGAATGLLLARAGYDVLVVDRGRYGSDTLSTHALMRAGVLQLERWGLLDRVVAAGTPPIHRVTFDYGGAPVVIDLDEPLYAPRRTILDRMLVDAAREAGAHVRFGVDVTTVRTDGEGRVTGIEARADGRSTRHDATLVVGADGLRSRIAQAAGAPETVVGRHMAAAIYGHYRGVPTDGYEWGFGVRSSSGAIPTNDGRTCVFVGATPERFQRELRHDRHAAMRSLLAETSPDLGARVAAGRLDGPLRAFPGASGRLRRPFGPGWALVGDAGYFKDPATAHGLSDALRDAELLVHAVDDGLTGSAPMQVALAGYERVRDDLSHTLFHVTDTIAGFGWRLPDLQSMHVELSRQMQREADHLEALAVPPVRDRLMTGS